ncbi:MAG TPA: hypothetical protein VKY73_14985 [Polyangiaceae bacterium]|nr:hypothetical protein [Polyangiaceae bacterium]
MTESPLEGVVLSRLAQATATVTGNVQIVNAAGGSATSVILVVEDTFDRDAARGEVPRGLRAPRTGSPNVTGAFTITGVPVGRYVVLAAYENDALVRDPNTKIAGTFVTLDVAPSRRDADCDCRVLQSHRSPRDDRSRYERAGERDLEARARLGG